MNYRPLLFRIMLIALGIAALVGVIGVMTSAGSGLWRVVGTSFLTSVAVALLLPASRLMDTPARRPVGLAATVWVVVAFILTLTIMWILDFPPNRLSARLSELLSFWFLCGIPAVILIAALKVEGFRVAAWTALVSVGLIFTILCLGTVILENSSRAFEKVALSSGLLALLGMLLTLNLVNAGCGDRRYFRWAGISAAVLGFLLAEAGIWKDTDSEGMVRVVVALMSAAILSGIANVLLQAPLKGLQVYVRWGTFAAVAICLLCINALLGRQASSVEEFLMRMSGASGIAAACGLLAIAIFARINRRGDVQAPADGSAPFPEMIALCPRCRSKQRFKINGTTCTVCHLRVDIKFEEPRCIKCGYLLYMLKSPNCPECGTAITASAQV